MPDDPERSPTYQSLRDRLLARLSGRHPLLAAAGRLALIPPDGTVFLGRLLGDSRLDVPTRGRLAAAVVLLSPPGLPWAVLLPGRPGKRLLHDAIEALHAVLQGEPDPVQEAWPGRDRDLERLRALVAEARDWADEGFGPGLTRRLRRRTSRIRRLLQRVGVTPRGL